MNRPMGRLPWRYRAAAILGGIPATGRCSPPELLRSTGALSIGRASYHWVEAPRDALAADAAKRELMAHIWYPASPQPAGPRAAYLPDFRAIEAAVGRENLKALAEEGGVALLAEVLECSNAYDAIDRLIEGEEARLVRDEPGEVIFGETRRVPARFGPEPGRAREMHLPRVRADDDGFRDLLGPGKISTRNAAR